MQRAVPRRPGDKWMWMLGEAQLLAQPLQFTHHRCDIIPPAKSGNGSKCVYAGSGNIARYDKSPDSNPKRFYTSATAVGMRAGVHFAEFKFLCQHPMSVRAIPHPGILTTGLFLGSGPGFHDFRLCGQRVIIYY